MLKQIPAILLSIVFIVFGVNYFLQFLKIPPMAGDAGTYIGILYSTKYLLIVKIFEVLFGLLILLKPTRALGLLLIAPIVVNIFLFEVCIEKEMGIGLILIALNALAIFFEKHKYWSIVAK